MQVTGDEELLYAHVAGDRMRSPALIERHHSHLWAVAVRTCGNPHDAADALQEALISAYQTADQFRGEGSAGGWLHRIVVNCSLDRLRRNKLTGSSPLPTRKPHPFADPPTTWPVSICPCRSVMPCTNSPTSSAPSSSPSMSRTPLAEVARRLDLPVGTIKSRSSRARARLARLLGHLVDPDMDVGGSSMHEHPNPPDPSARPMPAYPVGLLADLRGHRRRGHGRTSAHISTTTPGLSWRRSIVRSPTSRPGRWRRRKCPTRSSPGHEPPWPVCPRGGNPPVHRTMPIRPTTRCPTMSSTSRGGRAVAS